MRKGITPYAAVTVFLGAFMVLSATGVMQSWTLSGIAGMQQENNYQWMDRVIVNNMRAVCEDEHEKNTLPEDGNFSIRLDGVNSIKITQKTDTIALGDKHRYLVLNYTSGRQKRIHMDSNKQINDDWLCKDTNNDNGKKPKINYTNVPAGPGNSGTNHDGVFDTWVHIEPSKTTHFRIFEWNEGQPILQVRYE